MLRKTLAAILAVAALQTPVAAQVKHGGDHPDRPHLHTSDRWKECSFQLNAALTPAAWEQFTREAGLVVYFRSLTDARPMGKGKFELSLLQWKTGIDDGDAAWNDTFVHPDDEHYLFDGSGLAFPGLSVRVGVTSKTDVGLYFTKNPNANYGFAGVQVQRNVINDTRRNLAAAARISAVSMYGPDDLNFGVLGTDFVVSYVKHLTGWASVSPYIGVANYIAHSHEKSAVVDLKDETQLGSQVMLGATLQVSGVRIAAEYANASVKTVSLKFGVRR
jgi:hypothetical protein